MLLLYIVDRMSTVLLFHSNNMEKVAFRFAGFKFSRLQEELVGILL